MPEHETAGVRFLYGDETNLQPDEGRFFVYSGVVVQSATAASLSEEISRIRRQAGYRGNELLKFNTKHRPEGVSVEAHRAAKQEIMGAAQRHGVRLIATLVSHDIADERRARAWQINQTCKNFDTLLNESGEYGLVMLDQYTDPNLTVELRTRFLSGLEDQQGNRHALDRILGYNISTGGSSHFACLADVVAGALRYAVNAVEKPRSLRVAGELLAQLAPLCVRDARGCVRRQSLCLLPLDVRHDQYRGRYHDLVEHLYQGGMELTQLY